MIEDVIHGALIESCRKDAVMGWYNWAALDLHAGRQHEEQLSPGRPREVIPSSTT
jgi:hypothetical protein